MLASHATNAVDVEDRIAAHWHDCRDAGAKIPYEEGMSMVGVADPKCGRNRCKLVCEEGFAPVSRKKNKTWCRYNQKDGFYYRGLVKGCEKVCAAMTSTNPEIKIECWPKQVNNKKLDNKKKCFVSCQDEDLFLDVGDGSLYRRILNYCTYEERFENGLRTEPFSGWKAAKLNGKEFPQSVMDNLKCVPNPNK